MMLGYQTKQKLTENYGAIMFKESLKTFKFIKSIKELNSIEDDIAKNKAHKYLKQTLGTEGGILTKIMQYMDTSYDNSNFVEDGPDSDIGMSLEMVTDIIKEAYPNFWECFSDIEEKSYPASVGQVNAGNFKGEKVAIKIQYPGIKDSFKDQLRLLNILPKAAGFTKLKKWGVDFSGYQKQIEFVLDHECDYQFEASELSKWALYLNNSRYSHVPKVLPEFVQEKIYFQEFVDGCHLNEVLKTWSPELKKDLASNLFYTYFKLIFQYRVIQGDTNHDNFLFKEEGDKSHLYFIDLGQSIYLSDEFVLTLMNGIHMLIIGEKVPCVAFLAGLGFDPKKLEHIYPKLDFIIEILMEPFVQDFVQDLSDWDYASKIDLLLGEDKWWFRSAGGVEFFLFMKSLMGIKNLLTKLNVKVFYKKLFKDIYLDLQFKPTPLVELKMDLDNKSEYISENISIVIKEIKTEIEKVNLVLPIRVLFDIHNYLEPNIKKVIEENGVDLRDQVRLALDDGGKPKNIFEIDLEDRHYCISIK
jgi:predicted unusual protein kinase regulating ubiquinone biosynthesis (AarF/ABC1/UbiB family)